MSVSPVSSGTSITLHSAALPQRVRQVLERLFGLLAGELTPRLEKVLAEFEQHVFRMAEQARNPALQSDHLEALRLTRLNRHELIPRYLAELEASLARLREPVADAGDNPENADPPPFHNLSLVEDHELDEENVLRDIVRHAQARANLTLQLLGQRFGVLAGMPALDAGQLPVGPHALGRNLRETSQVLGIGLEPRLLLFRTFGREVMAHYAPMADRMDALLVDEHVLPSLSYVPFRTRPLPQGTDSQDAESDSTTAESADDAPTDPHADGASRDAGNGANRSESASDATATFSMLQQLLAARRVPDSGQPAQDAGQVRHGRPAQGGGNRRPLTTSAALQALDALPIAASTQDGGIRSLGDARQALLVQARQQRGGPASLSREDSDVFELLDILYAQIDRQLRHDTQAPALLGRLQLPLLRVALQDRAFFSDARHPARELVNAVAESGANWIDEDDADPQLIDRLRQAVEHVIGNRRDPAAFETANRELQTHLQALARRAQIAERRHVEAARGQEKLELAKRSAAGAIEDALRDRQLPRFMGALLNQAWADALTLTLLRHGQASPEWDRQLDATRRIVSSATAAARPPADVALIGQIKGSLMQVGYHVDEASAIAQHLGTGTNDGGDEDERQDDRASRTELALRLKARARLGEDHAAPRQKPGPATRSTQEQAAYDRLRALPFGTWFEFTVDPQGHHLRRRLSWFSPITDNALFVNRRGQRVGEQSFDSLARMLAHGQVRVVATDRERLVDRAWQGTLKALRTFIGSDAGDAGSEPTT